MQRRIISGGLALIVFSMSVSSMFISASAVAPLAAAAAAVGIGQVFAWVLNEMTGGQGYDLSDAITDMIEVTVDWCEGVPDAVGRGVDYTVKGYNIIGDAINNYFDTMEDAGSALFDFTGTVFEGYDPGEVLTRSLNVINQKIEEGKIFIGYDENGELVMSTKDYCSLIDYIYSDFGVEIDGDKRTYNTVKIVSDYASWYNIGPSFSSNVFSYDYLMNGASVYSLLNIFPILITSSDVYLSKFWFANSFCDKGEFSFNVDRSDKDICNTLSFPEDAFFLYGNYGYTSWNHMISDIIISGSISDNQIFIDASHKDMVSHEPMIINMSDYGGITFYNSSQTYEAIVENEDVINWGWVGVERSKISDFREAVESGEDLLADVIDKNIPLTGTEDVIKDMGLAGVGSSAKPGTVEFDKEGNVTVTDSTTGASELVQDYPTVGDIDVPDGQTIFDKFPFSLPFDLYRLITIFVAEPEEPIFTFPIETSFEMEGIEVDVDEELVADFTQFEIGGVDIIQLLVRTGFYILFISFLIKITPTLIKH